MAELKCVEPAMMSRVPGSDYVCLAAPNDTLLFPHVDVCMAVVWITEALTPSWRMIGGHVPGKWDEHSSDDLKGCAERVFALMDRQWGARSIAIVVAMGDPSGMQAPGWTQIIKNMLNNLDPKKSLVIWKDTPGGADLKVDFSAGKVTMSSSRTAQFIYEKDFSSMTKGEERHIKYDAPVLFKTVESWKSQFKDEQDRIINLFRDIYQHHGDAKEVHPPLNSGVTGEVVFCFQDGEKVVFHVEFAQHHTLYDRYQIKNVTSMFRKYGGW